MLYQPPFECSFKLPTCIHNSHFKSYRLLAIVRFRSTMCCSKTTVSSKYIFLLCITFVLPIFYADHRVSKSPWNKEREKKEKEHYALHCLLLPCVQRQTCILLMQTLASTTKISMFHSPHFLQSLVVSIALPFQFLIFLYFSRD